MKKLLLIPLSMLLIIMIPMLSGLLAHHLNLSILPPSFAKTTPKGGSLTISCLDAETNEITEIDIEAYLPGVLAAEMPASFELEALKAQAVAARSYIISKLDRSSPDHPSATVCSDPNHCKAYITEEAAKSRWSSQSADAFWDKLCRAASETEGEYMVYEDQAVEAFFFAGSNGRTENAEDVWGESRPYLKSVESPGDLTEDSLYSTVKLPISEFKTALGLSSNPSGTPSATPAISHISRTEGNNVDTITIDGATFRGVEIRQIFGLKSADFDLSFSDDTAIFSVRGSGHGVGMSQFGANYMAQKGKNYTEILSHYYTNIQIIKL